MSEDELNPMQGGDEGDSDGEFGDDFKAPDELPEGIQKEIVKEAPSDNWKKPKAGDDVTVHYVGTLASDGSEFDSSRSRGKPFEFALGRNQVIKGWDLGVATMKKGEIAKFTLSPEYAYGDAGSPPKIPEKATLVFEVEHLSWASKDDLFGDEGVIKTLTKEGSGWKTPKEGDEVLISVKATAGESVLEEKHEFEYKIGSQALGPISNAVEKALNGMKKGEEASLKCSKDYAYGDRSPDGATVEISMLQLFESKDVSFAKDKSVMKKQVQEGEGWDTPKDNSSVKLSVESATADGSPVPGFTPKVLEFTAGSGNVCDALEMAVLEMKKGEKSVLTVSDPSLVVDSQLGIAKAPAGTVVMKLELQELEKGKDTWNMSEEEKVEYGAGRKDVGAALFKSGRTALALERYKKVVDLFNYIDNFKEENKTKAKELKKACELNKAACYLKLQNFSEAKSACNGVLKDDSSNVKAMYRRAQAEHGLKNFLDCIAGCKRVIEMDATNREARTLLKQAQAGQKEEDKKSKGLYANMCKALGKGPIPPPGKTAPLADDDDFEDEEDEKLMESEMKNDEPGKENGKENVENAVPEPQ